MSQTRRSLRWDMAAFSVVSLLLMAYIDYVTGNELIFSAAYLLPVSVCAWYFGIRTVWLMSLACGVTSYVVDYHSGHTYTFFIYQVWNAFICFLVCLVTGLLLVRLKHTLEERKRMNDELQKALEDLRASTEEIRKLQNGLQVVCAWTQRIKVGDQWMTAEEFLIKQLHLNLSHGMSPEAATEWGKDLEQAMEEKKPLPGSGTGETAS